MKRKLAVTLLVIAIAVTVVLAWTSREAYFSDISQVQTSEKVHQGRGMPGNDVYIGAPRDDSYKGTPTNDGSGVSEQKVIKTASAEVEVEDFDSAVRLVSTIAHELDGLITSSSRSQTEDNLRANFTIRVPHINFEALLNRLEQMGEVKRLDIWTHDVTEEFIDLDARLKVYQEQEQAYIRLLEKAQTIADILEIERELSRIRAEIERITGRLRYLENQVEHSTLHLVVAAKKQPTQAPVHTFAERIRYALRDGWGVFVTFVTSVIAAAVWMLPFLLLILPLALLLRLIWRRGRKHQE